MAGRSVVLRVEKSPARPGDVVLAVDALQVRDDRRQLTVEGARFEVRSAT
jgi:simple sugar transport system ATP-binding protein